MGEPMKHSNKQRRLAARQKHFEQDRAMQDGNRKYPGSYTKPGSMKGK